MLNICQIVFWLFDAKTCQSLCTNISIELNKHTGTWYEIKSRELYNNIVFLFSKKIKENHVFLVEEDNSSKKVVRVEEELLGKHQASMIFLVSSLYFGSIGTFCS